MSDNPSMNGFDCSQLIKDFEALPANMGISQYWRSELNDRDKEVATLKGMVFKLQHCSQNGISQYWRSELDDRDKQVQTLTFSRNERKK